MPKQSTARTRRLINRREVCARLGGICESTLQNYVNSGRLPKPLLIGPNRVGWIDSDIDAYIDLLAAQRDVKRPTA